METYADAVKLEPSEAEALHPKPPKHAVTNGIAPPIVSSIPEVPVTMQRKPFSQPEDDERLPQAG